jgi:hypothetical protein
MPDTQTTIAVNPQVLASWQARVLPMNDRSPRWYLIGGITVLILAAYGILTGSWSFTVVMLLCGAMYYLMRDHVPPLKTITITEKGVQIEQAFVRWDELAGFWFLDTPTYTEVHFVPQKKNKSDVLIQTGSQNLADLRVLISTYIPELTDKKESFLDALLRTAKL